MSEARQSCKMVTDLPARYLPPRKILFFPCRADHAEDMASVGWLNTPPHSWLMSFCVARSDIVLGAVMSLLKVTMIKFAK